MFEMSDRVFVFSILLIVFSLAFFVYFPTLVLLIKIFPNRKKLIEKKICFSRISGASWKDDPSYFFSLFAFLFYSLILLFLVLFSFLAMSILNIGSILLCFYCLMVLFLVFVLRVEDIKEFSFTYFCIAGAYDPKFVLRNKFFENILNRYPRILFIVCVGLLLAVSIFFLFMDWVLKF